HGIWFTSSAAYLPGRIDQFACGMAAACLVANAGPGAVLLRKSTVVLAGLLAVACLVLVGRNTSTQLDFWFVFGPTLAGVAIALFIATLGVYAKRRAHRAPDAAKGGLTRTLLLFGNASLSIYLWHTFCIDLALVAAARFGLGATARAMLLC